MVLLFFKTNGNYPRINNPHMTGTMSSNHVLMTQNSTTTIKNRDRYMPMSYDTINHLTNHGVTHDTDKR